MFSKKIVLLLTVSVMLFLTLTAVSASQENIAVDEASDMDSSVICEENLFDDSDNQILTESLDVNEDGIKEKDENIELTDSNGEFIDVNDAYVYLNQFRTSNGVWQWNKDDVTKTVFNTNDANKLQSLARDLNLEQTAKIRAKEIAESFSHTRPDGTDCFTAFPNGLSAMGENIAYGQTSAKEVTFASSESPSSLFALASSNFLATSSFKAIYFAHFASKASSSYFSFALG